MGILDIFKERGKSFRPRCIDFCDNTISIDGHCLAFPLSLDSLTPILGEPERQDRSDPIMTVDYIYDKAGIVFSTCDPKCIYLKSRKAFVDESHNIVSCTLYYGKTVIPIWNEKALPMNTCTTKLTFRGKFYGDTFKFLQYGRTDSGSFGVYCTHNQKNDIGENGLPAMPVCMSFDPPRLKMQENYKIKPYDGEELIFDHFNFKLAVLQVLIYDLELLTPYFDIYDFAEQYTGKEIDTESKLPIRAIVNYFKKLPIPKSLAGNIQEICMDGGNDIYMNIAPQWDGEDGTFDINDISEKEIAQLPQLKKVVLMSANFDKVSKVFQQLGIDAVQL